MLLFGAPVAPPTVQRTQAPSGAVDGLLRQAKGLRYAQRWFEAAALYRRVLSEQSTSPRLYEARFWLAATLEQDQRWDEAADAYTEFLLAHPDQRLLVKEAKLNRVRCWGLRQGQNPQATPGLLGALQDDRVEVQITAALQLAKKRDFRAVDALQKGLRNPTTADGCRLALASLGVKPSMEGGPTEGRFLVLRIQPKAQEEPVKIRIALSLARAVGGYMTDDMLRQARAKGVDMERLMDQALSSPKGTVLFSVEDKQNSLTVSVE